MTKKLSHYDVPFSRRETMIEAAESIDENGQYELAAQFTTTGRPEIFEGDTK